MFGSKQVKDRELCEYPPFIWIENTYFTPHICAPIKANKR